MSEPEDRVYPLKLYRRRRRWPWLVVPLLLLAGGWFAWQGWKLPLDTDEKERVLAAEKTLGTQPLDLWGSDQGKTILLVGADRREGIEEKWGRSDTIIVARLLPDQKIVSLLSLPRDLQVEIPGYGFDKINAAYSYGGPRLLIATVRDFTGASIDHFVEIDFDGFARMIDEVGGVYLPVDQRYYNSNEGLSAEEMYSEIDIEPGYQLLGPEDALAFVRYRHTDSDFLRASRQQIFLRELSRQLQDDAKDTGRLFSLARAFSDATASDIRSPQAMFEIGKIARSITSDRIVRVTPEADEFMSGGVYYLSTSPEQRARALEIWNNPSLLTESGGRGLRWTSLGKKILPASTWLVQESEGRPFRIKNINQQAPLAFITNALSRWRPLFYSTNSIFAGLRKELFLARARKNVKSVGRDNLRAQPEDLVDYPAPAPPDSPLRPCQPQELPAEYSWPEGYREYELEGKPALALYAGRSASSGILWNWTSWNEAPILRSPDRIISSGRRKLFLFWDSGRLRLVAWRSGKGYGWVTNTLDSSLGAGTMLALARSCK